MSFGFRKTIRGPRGRRAARAVARRLAVFWVAGLVVGLPARDGEAQEDEYSLRLSDQVGQVNRYRLAFDIRMRAEYAGEVEPDERTRRVLDALASGMGIRTAVEYEQRLTEVSPDGTRVFEVRWRDFDFSGEIAGQPIPPPPLHVQSTRELLSQRARVRTTATGRTKDVAYDHPGLAGLGRQFEQLEGAMPTYLPERPVGVGDGWSGVAEFPLGLAPDGGGTLTLTLEHRLAEVRPGEDGPIAVIELSGSYSRLKGIETFMGAPMHMEASLIGSTLFDIESGRFVGGRYEIDMFALHAAEGIEIQLTGHANGKLELLRP